MSAQVANANPVNYTPADIDPSGILISYARSEITVTYHILDSNGAIQDEQSLTLYGPDFTDYFSKADGHGISGSDSQTMIHQGLIDSIAQIQGVTYQTTSLRLDSLYISLQNQSIDLMYFVVPTGFSGLYQISGQDFANAITFADSHGPAGASIYQMLRFALYDKVAEKTGWSINPI